MTESALRPSCGPTATSVRSPRTVLVTSATTTLRNGQQWDAPNGWAPLQWIAIKGLDYYGQKALAASIAERWIRRNIAVYRETGKLVEKYDLTGTAAAGGGEYALQDGFGWTNGVLRKLIVLYPAAAESGASR